MPKFVPPECPYPACPRHTLLFRRPFLYRRRGYYKRLCGSQPIPRFQCLTCGRRFSSQTFRKDYRHHKPDLNPGIVDQLISKVSQRQIARNLGCNPKTVARRVPLLRSPPPAGPRARAHRESDAPRQQREPRLR
jgi:transposase-like protein